MTMRETFVKERNDNVRNCKEMGVIQAPGAETMCKEPDRWCGSPQLGTVNSERCG